MPIADAVRLAGVIERLTDAQEPRSTFLLTPRTHNAHRRLICLSYSYDDPARSAAAVPRLVSRKVGYLRAVAATTQRYRKTSRHRDETHCSGMQ
jgi:hypothetical protein